MTATIPPTAAPQGAPLRDSLAAAVMRLAVLREEEKQRSDAIKSGREAFEVNIADDVAQLSECSAARAACEAEVRALATTIHAASGEKKVSAGVDVIVAHDYIIDEPAGLAWAREKQMCLVPESLDIKAVKKLATVQELPFVRREDKPQVRIATDLPKALGVIPVVPDADLRSMHDDMRDRLAAEA